MVLEVPAPVRGVLRELRVKGGTTVTMVNCLRFSACGRGCPDGTGRCRGGCRPGSEARPGPQPVVPCRRMPVLPASRCGRDGRILKSDVVGSQSAVPGHPRRFRRRQRQAAIERRVAMTRLRARIAERMVEAQHNSAMLTTFNEVDMSAVMALRSRYKDAFEKQHGIRLGFMGFFVKAAIEGLQRFPAVNASIEGNEIVYHDYYDIGIAVSTERGLVVPVVRDADRLSFAGIDGAINDYGRKAREGSLGMEDLTGGTFTITNGGVFGSLLSTPILNPPQSGILGMHKIQERPVVIDGQVVARPMMYVALTYDHRIIDGRDAVQFLVVMKDALEDPARLLLGI